MSNNSACQILIIDPDPNLVSSAVRALGSQGFDVQGVTKIDQIGRASEFVSRPQLVFVDLEFAERSPDQFQRFAQARNRYVVVLFPTGLTPYHMSRIFKLGAYDCVDKPYDMQSLVELATSLVKEVCLLTWNAASLIPDGLLAG